MIRTARRSAFSLIELVIVVVIIGIIAAIAIPRMSRGASGASDAALQSNLRQLRNAIDMFYTEHDNTFPLAATFTAQITTFSDSTGAANATRTTTYVYGPYLRQVPTQSVGPKKGQNGVASATGASIGWLYTESAGTITANTTTETDARGVLYSTY